MPCHEAAASDEPGGADPLPPPRAVLPFHELMWPRHLPPAYWLAGAHVPAALLDPSPPAGAARRVAMRIEGERIAAVGPQPLDDEAPVFDLDGSVVLSAFVDAHAHLDKGDLLATGLAPQHDLLSAIDVVRGNYSRWTEGSLRARIGFALRGALAHGTRALNSYCDWLAREGPQGPLAWGVLQELRRDWAGRIDLTLTSLAPLGELQDLQRGEAMARQVAAARGVLGWFVYPGTPIELLPRAFDLAERHDLRLDFHIDEHLDPPVSNLQHVLRLARERGYGERTVCGHCCALNVIDAGERDRVLDAVAAAGVALVSLPNTNLYLQGGSVGGTAGAGAGAGAGADTGGARRRARRTPQRRGLLPLHEARERGIRVSLASDNHRDPFFPYGDLDPLQTLGTAALAAQLDEPIERWADTITTAPASALHLPWDGKLRAGAPVDLVVFPGRSSAEVLGRGGAGRRVLRRGHPLKEPEAQPPDFRELDALLAGLDAGPGRRGHPR